MGAYDQPEKKRARWLALCRAVESLTAHRDTSPVVTLDRFRRGMQFACDRMVESRCNPCPHEQVKAKSEAFAELHATRIGTRKANELQVLMLSGPEPMNDLEVMFELGIRPENIWAIEADKKAFTKAVENLLEKSCGIKIYRGALKPFVSSLPEPPWFPRLRSSAAALLGTQASLLGKKIPPPFTLVGHFS